jgi:hypothetical protein
MLHNRRQYLGAVIASTFLCCLILPLQLAESKRFARQNAFKEYRRSPELQRLAQASLFVRGGDESEIGTYPFEFDIVVHVDSET